MAGICYFTVDNICLACTHTCTNVCMRSHTDTHTHTHTHTRTLTVNTQSHAMLRTYVCVVHMWNRGTALNSVLIFFFPDLQTLFGSSGELKVWLVLELPQWSKVYLQTCSPSRICPQERSEKGRKRRANLFRRFD